MENQASLSIGMPGSCPRSYSNNLWVIPVASIRGIEAIFSNCHVAHRTLRRRCDLPWEGWQVSLNMLLSDQLRRRHV